jgi:chromosome partitioning protein
MTSPNDGEREKIVSKLPAWLHRDLKVRAVQLGIDIQDAVAAGIGLWRADGAGREEVDTAGADSFSTWLPEGLYDDFRGDCAARGVSYVQGLAQAVTMWLDANPAAAEVAAAPHRTRRIAVVNQKGGVGKTAVSAGLAQALAEGYQVKAGKGKKPVNVPGIRVLLVDYDPQGHLSKQLGVPQIEAGQDSLALHMSGEAKGDIRDLIVVLPQERWGGRLHLLPACPDAFLLDVRLSQLRARERALERALAGIEDDYDAILFDCPPSLGMSVDAVIYYVRRREGDKPGASGALIPVQAEDSSADAFTMLTGQISDLCDDVNVTVDYLGLVVTMYDARRGYIATSSLDNWKAMGDPRVVATVPDLKEQREAVRQHQPLLDYAPKSEQSAVMRDLAKEIS